MKNFDRLNNNSQNCKELKAKFPENFARKKSVKFNSKMSTLKREKRNFSIIFNQIPFNQTSYETGSSTFPQSGHHEYDQDRIGHQHESTDIQTPCKH